MYLCTYIYKMYLLTYCVYIYMYLYCITFTELRKEGIYGTYNQRCMGFMYILGYDWDISWDKLSLS